MVKIKKQQDPLVKFIQKRIRVGLRHGTYIEGHLTSWDDKVITIQIPARFDYKGNTEFWRLVDIERFKIINITLTDSRKGD